MTLTAILLLILLGLILLLLEILVLPGMIVGVIGIGLMIFGISNAYYNLGTSKGNYVLAGTVISSVLLIYLSFRSNTWKKLALNSTLKGNVNTLDENLIQPGDIGFTISKVANIGKASINDLHVEVYSENEFINENTEIVVVKNNHGKIVVKKMNVNGFRC